MKGKYKYFYAELLQETRREKGLNLGALTFKTIKVVAKLGRSITEPRELLGKTFIVMYSNDSGLEIGTKGKINRTFPDKLELFETANDCIGAHFDKFL